MDAAVRQGGRPAMDRFRQRYGLSGAPATGVAGAGMMAQIGPSGGRQPHE